VSDKQENIRAYYERLLDERLRSYVVVVAAALLVIFVSGLIAGSLYAGLIPALAGIIGLALRWPAMPMVCVATVAWFQALPFGVPIVRMSPIEPRFTHFRIQDLMLVAAVLVYLIAQYRLLSLAHRAVPDERRVKARRADKQPPELRDAADVEEREIPQLLVVTAIVLLAGQALWLALSETILDFRSLPPFRLREGGFRDAWHYASREVMFALGLGFALFFGRLGFWVWKLKTMNRDEAQLALADTGWLEMRREAARQETWRVHGKLRARAKVVVPAPKRRKKPSRPWLGQALGRACLTLLIAIVIAFLLVCAGVIAMRGIFD
jgi:hypothetical protein